MGTVKKTKKRYDVIFILVLAFVLIVVTLGIVNLLTGFDFSGGLSNKDEKALESYNSSVENNKGTDNEELVYYESGETYIDVINTLPYEDTYFTAFTVPVSQGEKPIVYISLWSEESESKFVEWWSQFVNTDDVELILVREYQAPQISDDSEIFDYE